jgi:hypothetical protein
MPDIAISIYERRTIFHRPHGHHSTRCYKEAQKNRYDSLPIYDEMNSKFPLDSI